MKIFELSASDFMLFQDLRLRFSDHINIILGDNSTGKTALLKLLYAQQAVLSKCSRNGKEFSKEEYERLLVQKLIGVFKPDNDSIGRLAYRKQGVSKASVSMKFSDVDGTSFAFTSKHSNHIDILVTPNPSAHTQFTPVYIPPKEIISSAGNFPPLYEEYKIGFDETYYDLAKLLLWPLRRGPYLESQKEILRSFEDIMQGTVVQQDNKFYLKMKRNGTEKGNFEMGLVSEGYRKLSTLMYLVLSGGLSDNSILFWDEPESNMNPKMIYPVAKAIMQLSKMVVQVFITTHSYFVQQAFNITANYPDPKSDPLNIKFHSLYRNDNDKICAESATNLSGIQHNAILEEFDELYDREQRLIDGEY